MTDRVAGRGLKRGALARRTGCNLETIRYYEKIDLMPAPPRTASGMACHANKAGDSLKWRVGV